jgi:nicotinamidase-related amidase
MHAMSTLQPQRTKTGLLIIDVQIGVMAAAYHRSEVISTIAALLTSARRSGAPVVWVQHSDDQLAINSPGWQYVPELVRLEGEPLVHKRYGDSFEGTDLESILAAASVSRLVVVGAQTDACIRSTIHGAFTRGYDVTLVSDAHTTEDMTDWGAPSPDVIIKHTNMYWGFQSAPGRTASVLPAVEVSFSE